jgi:micrococcal nuclease
LKVARVIDGDTLKLSTGETVRLIGVDTPETKDPRKPVQYFGKEATAFARQLVEGKSVRLAYDQQRQDKYGRTLAYVYLEDGRFVNAEIIQQGYGFAYTRYPFRYLEQFRRLEREAREAHRGLWGAR